MQVFMEIVDQYPIPAEFAADIDYWEAQETGLRQRRRVEQPAKVEAA